jgi:FMN phosphatase YigB (HAD superfamily)
VIGWRPRMTRAVLFDMGGTLDGDGLHWLDRFVRLYDEAGVSLPRDALRAAFDDAERRAAMDEAIATADLDAMIDRHVGWQLAHLSIDDVPLRHALAAGFVRPIRDLAAANARLLAGLSARGLRLGVVSNGCGNVNVLCDNLGYAPFLSLIVDSRRVGLFKPDPAIYLYAARSLGLPPWSIMMVGDSLDRDIRPAKTIGMQTAWLEGPVERLCPEPALADVRLRALADLPGALAARGRTVA